MKKFRKLATGLLFAGTVLCTGPAVAFAPLAENIAFADVGLTVEIGDAFEINADLTTEGYNVRMGDSNAEMDILSQEVYPGESDGTYVLYVTAVINTAGTQELIIENENGDIVKSVSVNVTEPSDEPDPSDEGSTEGEGSATGDTDAQGDITVDDGTEDSAPEEPEYLVFVPISNGKVTGKTESGEFTPGEKITLSAEADKGYVFRGWTVRNLDGRDVTKDLNISADNTFILPDYPIRISAQLEYNLIHEIELLDVTEKLEAGAVKYDEAGKPVIFTGHVKDNTDPRFFLLAEIWINEYDTKGITNSKNTNETLQKEGVTILDAIDPGDKYNYSVMFMTTEGYEFADDIKLLYNGKEYKPTKDEVTDGKETVTFSGFLSSGVQTNPPETKTTTKTVTRQETKKDTVTEYVTNTYTYTTYQYVTRVVPAGTASGNVIKSVAAPATGDSNNVGVWIALAIAAGGGVVSGILVGRRRKRNK